MGKAFGMMVALAGLASGAAVAGDVGPRFDESATLVSPGVVSTQYTEIRYSRSPGGRWALWGSTDRPGGRGGWDIWIAQCQRDVCYSPRAATISSDHNDFDPAFAPDGRHVYFFSNRPGGFGGDDIYVAAFDPRFGTFGQPLNLGEAINSAGDEWAPTISDDGLRLMFSTDGRGGAGGHDLFLAQRRGQSWTQAVPLRGAINTEADEFDSTWLDDGRTLVFARSKNVKEEPISLYWSRADSHGYAMGTALSNAVNVAQGYTLGPVRDWRDPQLLYFSSYRNDARAGKLDIYAIGYWLAP